jgi:hypothetical protein
MSTKTKRKKRKKRKKRNETKLESPKPNPKPKPKSQIRKSQIRKRNPKSQNPTFADGMASSSSGMSISSLFCSVIAHTGSKRSAAGILPSRRMKLLNCLALDVREKKNNKDIINQSGRSTAKKPLTNDETKIPKPIPTSKQKNKQSQTNYRHHVTHTSH